MLRLEDNELLLDEDDDGDRLMEIPADENAKKKSADQAPKANSVEQAKKSEAQ